MCAMLNFFFTLIFFQHYKLLSDRLQDLGSHFGALPVHGGKYYLIYFSCCWGFFLQNTYRVRSIVVCVSAHRVGLVQTDSGKSLPPKSFSLSYDTEIKIYINHLVVEEIDFNFSALWDSATKTSDSLLARLAVVHMVFEARLVYTFHKLIFYCITIYSKLRMGMGPYF